MSEQVAVLPDAPGPGDELEDYVAALFQASGHFVEKQIIDTDGTDILELDIVASRYEGRNVAKQIIEVKGGRWGYTDLFKVVGWMRYLGLERGAFFVTKWDGRDSAPARMEPMGLEIVCFDDFTAAPQQFQDLGFGTWVNGNLVDLWRSSYAAERKLIQVINARAKGGSAAAKEVKSYYKLVNSGTFMARTPEESLAMLYAAYQEHPKLTLGYGLEKDGSKFNPNSSTTDSVTVKAALWEGKHPELQAAMFLEHRARLAILKAAVDYLITESELSTEAMTDSAGFSVLNHQYNALPSSFKAGVDWLRDQTNFRLYATFWQQFLWGWGGFYLADRTAAEHQWMSAYSGIPADEIPVALKAFDHFFPQPGGWFVTPGATDMCRLKMMPWPFAGLGAAWRSKEYQLDQDLSDLDARQSFTDQDLIRRRDHFGTFIIAALTDL